MNANSNFKKGDFVYRNKEYCKTDSILKEGKKYEVIEVCGENIYIKGVSGVWFSRRFTLADTTYIDNTCNSSSWVFPVQSLLAIDWDTVISNLTKEKPVQLIEIDNGKVKSQLVAIHHSLLEKAVLLKIKKPNKPVEGFKQLFNCPKHFSEWVDWAKEVNTASWGKSSFKATVSVTQIPL